MVGRLVDFLIGQALIATDEGYLIWESSSGVFKKMIN
jgi:hypothetical protein